MTQLINDVHPSQKLYCIRPGRYHLFGTDFERRDDMTDREAIERFDKIWDEQISGAILYADSVPHDEAQRELSAAQKKHWQQASEHRRFRLEGTVFIAQVTNKGDRLVNDQLWAVSARNYDTRNLYVTFETQEDRNTWDQLAMQLGRKPDELGLDVLTGFLDIWRSRTGE